MAEDFNGMISLPAPKSERYTGSARKGSINLGRMSGTSGSGPSVVYGLAMGGGQLARGVESVADVLHQQEVERQYQEAAEDMEAFRDRERMMQAAVMQLQGKDAAQAYATMDNFYRDGGAELSEKARGSIQRNAFAQFIDSSRAKGLDMALKHQIAQHENYKQQFFTGVQARLDNDIKADPANYMQYGEEKKQLFRAQHPGANLEWLAANDDEIDRRSIDQAFWSGALAVGNLDLAGQLLGEAYRAKSGIGGPEAKLGQPIKVPAQAQQYMPLVNEAAETYKVPANIVLAVMATESGFEAGAVSETGVLGLMQVTQKTYEALGFTGDRADPRNSILAGTKLLGQLYEKYGNWDEALADYNGGPDGVKGLRTGDWGRWANDPAKQKQIKEYGPKVMSHLGKIGGGMVGPDGAEYGGLVPPDQIQKMQMALVKASEQKIADEQKAKIAELERLDRAGKLTIQDVMDANLSMDQTTKYLNVAEGNDGIEGFRKSYNKRLLEESFYRHVAVGSIYSEKDFDRWIVTNFGTEERPVIPIKIFSRQELDIFNNETLKTAKAVNDIIQSFIDVNPNYFSKKKSEGELEKALYKEKMAALIGPRRMDPKNDVVTIEKLLREQATNGRWKDGKDPFPGEMKGKFTDRAPQWLEDKAKERLKAENLPWTSFNLDRAEEAIKQAKYVREIMPPGADKWPGRGLMTNFDGRVRMHPASTTYKDYATMRTHKDTFEKYGQSYNVDPNLLSAIAYAVSKGDKEAKSALYEGGLGIMQLPKQYLTMLGITEDMALKAELNVALGAQILDHLLGSSNGDPDKALQHFAEFLPLNIRDKFIKDVNLYWRSGN